MLIQSNPRPTSIRNWEAAGASLADAVTNYLKLSSFLEASDLGAGENPSDVVSRIDTSLQTLHRTIDQQLNQSRIALAKTRNRLASPIYCFPEEILSEIFHFFTYSTSNRRRRHRSPLNVGEWAREIYRRLYNLLGVCSVWRQVCLSRPNFWSIVPMVDGFYACWHPLSVELSVQRSGLQSLHLVVDVQHQPASIRSEDFEPLIESLARIQSFNIHSTHACNIPFVLSLLFRRGVPENLSELSLCHRSEKDEVYQVPPDDYYFDHLGPLLPRFPKLMGSLRAFRISDIPLEWKHITFSARLTELCVNSIRLADDLAVTAFMNALSSAYELRDLKAIRIEVFSGGSMPPESRPPVSLPWLQNLYLEELYFNALKLLLVSITSHSCHLTLNLSERIRQDSIEVSGTEDVDVEDIHQLLAQHNINELILADDVLEWATGKGLSDLLSAMPNLKSLIVYFYEVDNQLFKAIEPPSHTIESPFPKLKVLEFRGSVILGNITGLRRLSTKHPIHRLVLGQRTTGVKEQVIGINRNDATVRWMEANVPGFQFIPADNDASEAFGRVWQSWDL